MSPSWLSHTNLHSTQVCLISSNKLASQAKTRRGLGGGRANEILLLLNEIRKNISSFYRLAESCIARHLFCSRACCFGSCLSTISRRMCDVFASGAVKNSKAKVLEQSFRKASFYLSFVGSSLPFIQMPKNISIFLSHSFPTEPARISQIGV